MLMRVFSGTKLTLSYRRNCALVEFVDVRAAIKAHALLGDVRIVNTEAFEGAPEHESTTKATEGKTTAGIDMKKV